MYRHMINIMVEDCHIDYCRVLARIKFNSAFKRQLEKIIIVHWGVITADSLHLHARLCQRPQATARASASDSTRQRQQHHQHLHTPGCITACARLQAPAWPIAHVSITNCAFQHACACQHASMPARANASTTTRISNCVRQQLHLLHLAAFYAQKCADTPIYKSTSHLYNGCIQNSRTSFGWS